ncbi:hypothetical protein [Choristoneura rosaceana nucleopolyhedrovirus]|uniref:Uncharacterized protein n=1 Tax=Choristoneura rosaceana nucleopolyhedrovirus TaxID=58094 RepID=S5N445_9ABAC|nr:hypothetical protein [Choristoneura rosaceana nucleopolyhedrovirus]AGR57150.1 hypothetical protein [Choristoneura rosaceana nucleopolyhedrovirus]
MHRSGKMLRVKEQSLSRQLDHINKFKRKIAVESQHFEKIYRLTKNTSELRDLRKRVMDSRQSFLNFGVQHF